MFEDLEPRKYLAATGSSSAVANAAYDLSLAPNSGEIVSAWNIDWGDGSATQSIQSPTATVSHTFATVGHRSIIATATDTNGAVHTDLIDTSVLSGADIGSPAIAGSSTYDHITGLYSITGGGAEIYNTSDQFQFASTNVSGNVTLVAKVNSQTITNSVAKAGLMFRASNDPDAPFVDVVITPRKGVYFQSRSDQGGTTLSASNNSVSGPIWLKLVRSGDNFAGFWSTTGTTWTQVGGTRALPNIGSTPLAGLAVTAHDNTAASTAVFGNVALQQQSSGLFPISQDIGTPPIAGSNGYDASSSTYTVTGCGAEIYSYSDQFHFASRAVTGDETLIARVDSQTNTDPVAKAGLMFRATSDIDSPFVDIVLTPGKGVYFQTRQTAGNYSISANRNLVSGPLWLKLVRTGQTYSGYYSTDGVSWRQVGATQTLPSLSGTISGGLAVTSHNTSAASTATFSNVAVVTPVVGTALVAPSVSQVIVSPSTVEAGQPITVSAAATPGADNGDALSYVWRFINTTTGAVDAVSVPSGTDPELQYTPIVAGAWAATLIATDTVLGISTNSTASFVAVPPVPIKLTGPTVIGVDQPATYQVAGYATNNLAWQVADSDNNILASGSSANFSFTPKDTGAFVVSVVGQNSNAAHYSDSIKLLVQHAAPTTTIVGQSTGILNQPLVFTSRIDVSREELARVQYSWSLYNEDGSPVTPPAGSTAIALPSNLSTFATPAFLAAGRYTVKLNASLLQNGATTVTQASFDFSIQTNTFAKGVEWGTTPAVAASYDNNHDLTSASIRLPDGRIAIAGYVHSSELSGGQGGFISVFRPDLTVDDTFGPAHTGTVHADFGLPFNPISWASYVDDIAYDPVNGDIIAVGRRLGNGSANSYIDQAESLAVEAFTTNDKVGPDGTIVPAGSPDPYFNGGQAFTLLSETTKSDARKVLVLDDGSVLVAGYEGTYSGAPAPSGTFRSGQTYFQTDFLLLKLTADGVLDSAFNPSGNRPGIAEQPNVTGRPSITPFLDRSQLPTGDLSLDAGEIFGADLGTTEADDIALVKDASGNVTRIVLGGEMNDVAIDDNQAPNDFAIAAYTPSGLVDHTFGTSGSGYTLTPATAFGKPAQGAAAIDRIQISGSAITAVGMTADSPNGLSYGNAKVAIARYSLNGILDTSYGTNGVLQTSIGYNILNSKARLGSEFPRISPNGAFAFQEDGKIVASLALHEPAETNPDVSDGILTNWRVLRIDPDTGLLDTTFGYTGTGQFDITTPEQNQSADYYNQAANFEPSQNDSSILLLPDSVIALGSSESGQDANNDSGSGSFYWAPLLTRFATTPSLVATDLTAQTDTDSHVTLTWKSEGFRQHGFIIRRASTVAGLANDDAVLAIVNAYQSDFVDATSFPGQSYYYSVTPFYEASTGALTVGSSSNVAHVTTFEAQTGGSESAFPYFQGTFSVSSNASGLTSAVATSSLQAGVQYQLIVSGEVDLGNGFSGDANGWYSENDPQEYGANTSGSRFGIGYSTDNGATLIVPQWITLNASKHLYAATITGTGQPIKFAYAADAHSIVQIGSAAPQVDIYAASGTAVTTGAGVAVRRFLPLNVQGTGPTTIPLVSSQTTVRFISATPNGTATPWALYLTSGTGQRFLLDDDTASAGALPGNGRAYVLDPASYPNGQYALQLTAGVGSTVVADSISIQISTAIKSGALVLPVTDTILNTAVGSIRIGRTYDSGRADQAGDMGYGWSSNLFDTHMEFTAQGDIYDPTWEHDAIRLGDKLSLTLPDGNRYTFQVDEASVFSTEYGSASPTSMFGEMAFINTDGSGARLDITNGTTHSYDYYETYDAGSNQYVGSHIPQRLDDPKYFGSPVDLEPFRTNFLVTTSEGVRYLIDYNTGLIQSVGNKDGSYYDYQYGTDAITATGPGGTVFVAHKQSGRITSITVPGQSSVLFNYDSSGNLVSTVNQDGASTQYRYQTADGRHLLTSVVNNQQRFLLTAKYDPQSFSLNSLTNAAGITVPVSSNGIGANQVLQTSVDVLGDVTENVYDELHGGLVRSIRSLFDDNGDLVKYVVSARRYTFAGERPIAESSLYDSSLELLQSVADYEPFEVDATNAAARFTAQPSNDNWVKLATYGTVDLPGVTSDINGDNSSLYAADRGLLKSVSQRTDDSGTIETTSFERYVRANGTGAYGHYSYFSYKPSLTVITIRTPNASSSTGYDSHVKSIDYTSYSSANGDVGYHWTSLGVPDASHPGYVLATGTHYDYFNRLPTAVHTVTGSIDQLGHVFYGDDVVTTQNTFYQISDLSLSGAVYGGLRYSIDAAGQETYYAYDSVGHPILNYQYKAWTDASGTHYGWVGTTTSYDARGRVVDVYKATYLDPNGTASNFNTVHILNVAGGNQPHVDTSLNPAYATPLRTTHNDYNSLGQKTQTIDEYGGITSYAYDIDGNVVRTAYSDGTEVRSVYDALGRQVWVTNRYAPSASTGTVATFTKYDSLGNAVSTQRYQGVIINLAAQTQATNVYYTAAASGGTLVSTTTNRYDPAGRVIESISPSRLRTGTIYTPDGKVHYTGVLKDIAPAGGRTTLVAGVYTQRYETSDFVSYSEQRESQYDATAGQFYDLSVDENGHSTRVYKDSTGRTTRTVYDDGSFTETLYSYGQSVPSHTAANEPITLPSNWQGMPGGGSVTVQIAERKSGDPIVATFNVYDVAGRLVDVYLPPVADADPASPTYSASGTQLTSPHWHYGYESAGNQTLQISPKEEPAYQQWIANGSVPTSIPPATRFAYDQYGHQVLQSLPDGESESWAYDAHQRLSSHVDFNGNVATYTYANSGTQAGLLQQVIYVGAPGSGKATRTVNYTYDALNRRKTVTDASGTTTYGYDVFGNLIEEATPEGTIHYGFDAATGEHTGTWTTNTAVAYAYNPIGQLSGVTVNMLNGAPLSTPLTTTYTYDAAGNKKTETLPSGEVTTYGYDDLNRLTSVLEQQGSTTLFSQSYALNHDGTRKSSDQSQRQPNGSTVATHTNWTYDADDRLVGEAVTSSITGQSYADTFAYDLNNNREKKTHTGPGGGANETIGYAYNGDDELTSQTSSVSGTTANTYDANGSLLTSMTNGQTTTYTYDTRNKLVGFSGNGKSASYVYDDAGNRVGESTGGVTTLYLTDTQNPTGYSQPIEQKATATASPTVTYLMGDRIFGQATPGGIGYLLVDGHGSTRAMTDASGAVTAAYNYDALGGPINFNPATAGTVFLFGGDAAYEPVSGLYLHGNGIRARQSAIMLQRDEFSGFRTNPVTQNKYVYAYQDPVSLRDPTGYWGEEEYIEASEAENALNVERLGQAVYDQAEAYETIVYQSIGEDGVNYVGITKDFAARAARHLATKGIEIEPIEELGMLTRPDARAVEQVLIEMYGLGKDGGSLLNMINSIAASNDAYPAAILRGIELLTQAGII